MRNTFINIILDACKTRDDVFILSGDAGLGVFDAFKDEYPDRFRNMGAAEQNAIGYAAGLALTGHKVIVYNIIPFVLYRCYEQVRNDICGQNLPVVLVGIGSGITYAPQGMSHYSVEDIGLIQTLPNLVAISPMDPVEARSAAEYALRCDKPVYVRLAKRGEPVFCSNDTFNLISPHIVREGGGTAIVFHGSISREVMAAYDLLKTDDRAPLLISVPTVQPLDVLSLLGLLAGVRHVVCVEEHFINCGLGSMLARIKAEHSAQWDLRLLGIPPQWIREVGTTNGLRSTFGISAAEIARAVKSSSEG